MSLFYKSASCIKNIAYDRRWITSKKANPIVISIGNIVAGGTGKTPLIALLLERLKDKKISLLSRGYRSKTEHASLVACENKGPLYSSEEMGDESYMLAQQFPSLFLFIGKKREKALHLDSVKNSEILLLDDGMQYKKIQKDLEIVCMHADDLFGQGHFLPRGFLRDHPKRLKHVDLIFINHVKDEEHFFYLKQQVLKYTSAQVIGMKMKHLAFFACHTNEKLNIKHEKVGLFCSIANPASFYRLIENRGLQIVDTYFELDHKPISRKKLHRFADLCIEKKAERLICTEKDSVKLPCNDYLPLPMAYSKIRLDIFCNKFAFEELIEKIVNNMQR